MFNRVYFRILCQSYSDIQQRYRDIVFRKLSDQNFFKKFVTTNIRQSDSLMSSDLIDYYQQNTQQAIRSALVWKSLVAVSEQFILLDYQIQPGKEDTQNLHFIKYSIKQQSIVRQIYSIYGKSKYMFFNMDKKHQSLNKIYNTMKKYAFKIM